MKLRRLIKRNGIYHFRVKVPAELQGHIGKKEIHKSLGACRYNEVTAKALGFSVKIDYFFQYLLDNPKHQIDIDSALKNMLSESGVANYSDIKKEVESTSAKLSQLLPKFLDFTKQGHNNSGSIIEVKRFVELFIRFVEDKNVLAVDAEDCRSFIDVIAKIPSNHSRKPEYNGKTLYELAKAVENKNVDLISQATVKKYIIYVRAYFNWLVSYDYIKSSPFPSKLKFSREKNSSLQKRKSFSKSHLSKLFNSDFFKNYESLSSRKNKVRYWAPLLSLYTGCRPVELMQLQLKDIKQTEQGIWYIYINSDGFVSDDNIEIRKTTKTLSSVRKIPLHSDLTKLGLIDFLKEQKESFNNDERLLFGFNFLVSKKNGSKDLTKNMTRFYNRYFAKINLIESGNGYSYYSLRHNFRDALSDAEVQDSVISSLMGHEDARVTFNTYGKSISLEILYKSICKMNFADIFDEKLNGGYVR